MATFTACTRIKRHDGLYPVYIRVAHNSKTSYIKTEMLVSDTGLRTVYSKSGKGHIEISDNRVLKKCFDLIESYAGKVNNIDAAGMDCNSLVEYLTQNNGELSFTEYANEFIKRMYNEGRDNSLQNYRVALVNLQKFLNKENIMFRELTSNTIYEWINSMKGSPRKNSLYPTCVRAIINAATREYNDYDNGIIRIRTNPFAKVKIPKQRVTEKRSVEPSVIRRVLLSESTDLELKEFARDVSMMIFCLAGINSADLYDMNATALKKDWKLCYNRKKTRGNRSDQSYMEITVPEQIRPLFKKYKGTDGKLFIFSKRYYADEGLIKGINTGLKSICKQLGLEENITTYTFRHSWATIAKNNCGASTEQVAFSLNHASVHRITEGYIRKDYTPIDKLNNKVIELVFGV